MRTGFEAEWPKRLVEISSQPAAHSDRRLWILLSTVLRGYAEFHASRNGALGDDDLQDIASQKTLELIESMRDGRWNPAEDATRVKGFLSTIARNAVIDCLRDRSRQMPHEDMEPVMLNMAISPGREVEQEEFVQSLLGCVSALEDKKRWAWYLRSCLEFRSQEIANHPEVRLSVGNVDVMLGRIREQMRECMRKKGQLLEQLPPGSFARLWDSFRHSEGRMS